MKRYWRGIAADIGMCFHFTHCRCAKLETLINVTIVTEPVKDLVDNTNYDEFVNKTNPLIRTGW